MTWAFDSPENVPWVKCLIAETAALPESLDSIREHARYLHMKIDPPQYANLIANPQNYHSQIGFPAWNIPELTGSADSIVDGARNIRLLGRLALLFPPNFTMFHREVRDALAELQALDPGVVRERFSKHSGDPVAVDLSEDIQVYVAGTLCGGTSSGSFIDVGYLLQSLTGFEGLIKTTGIFLLPPSGYPNAQHLGNAYAALLELNHFSSDGSRYRQQMPHRVDPLTMPSGMRPYHQLYLLQARGPAKIEYAKLITAGADYIYSDVLGGTRDQKEQTRTNIAQEFVQRDLWGATQKFYTFGVGSIEFPYTKVAKACSFKLAGVGFRDLGGGDLPTQSQVQEAFKKIGLLSQNEMDARLVRVGDEVLFSRISRIAEGATTDALRSDDTMDAIRTQLESAFKSGGKSSTHPDLPANIVPQTIEENERQVAVELRNSIASVVRIYLGGAEPSLGIVSLESFLTTLRDKLEQRIKECATVANASGGDLSKLMDDALERARDCRKDPVLAVMLGRNKAVHHYVTDAIQHCRSYFTQRLHQACAPAGQRLYKDALVFVTRLLDRIQNQKCGLRREVQLVVEGLKQQLDEVNVAYGSRYDGSVRVINGVELFDAHETVDSQYDDCLRETATLRKIPGDLATVEALLAREAVASFVEAALGQLLAEPNEVKQYDPAGGRTLLDFDAYRLLQLSQPARAPFAPLKRTSIIERLMARPEAEQDVRKADKASELLLNWDSGSPRHRDAVNKSWKYVFYNDQDRSAPELKRLLDRAGVLTGQGGISYINDPHQIIFLQERGAFSLGTITDLSEDQSVWFGEYRSSTMASFHSRGDIREWISWGRSDEETRSSSRNAYLVGIALGIVEFVNATQYCFTYEPPNPVDSGKVLLSRDLLLACQELKQRQLAPILEAKIQKFRNDNGPADVYRRIDEFIRNSDKKFSIGDKSLSNAEILTFLLDYIRQDTELFERFNRAYPNQAELQLLRPDRDGVMAYHCPESCGNGYVLGYKASDLYIEEQRQGRMERVRKCAFCKRNL
jgi:hypothetical protein